MRLLCTKTLELKEFSGNTIPRYAILSHTWYEGQEVTLPDLQSPEKRRLIMAKQEYAKIKKTCDRALKDGLDYAWVDTCCIDKTSSAELSEAINSMMGWYERSDVCYAFLEDVPPGTDAPSAFARSRWFTRGWTLQELIAPRIVKFFASDWSLLNEKRVLSDFLSEITGINKDVLNWGGSRAQETKGENLKSALNSASIAQRMSWAAKRQTTREEDLAYCLLGIFGINMPLIYGEGSRAFFRLQEEIIKRSDDQTILAWNFDGCDLQAHSIGQDWYADTLKTFDNPMDYTGVLADSPLAFQHCKDIVTCDLGRQTSPFSITNKGLEIELPLAPSQPNNTGSNSDPTQDFHKFMSTYNSRALVRHVQSGLTYALLQCQHKNVPGGVLALPLQQTQRRLYVRPRSWKLVLLDCQLWYQWRLTPLYLLTEEALLPQPALWMTNSLVNRLPEIAVVLRNLPPNLFVFQASPSVPQGPGPRVILVYQYKKREMRENRAIVSLGDKDAEETELTLIVKLKDTYDTFGRFGPPRASCCLGKGKYRSYWDFDSFLDPQNVLRQYREVQEILEAAGTRKTKV
ncbi:hypothetical protein B7463_g4011, partial [Scytalidium lignicola]